MGVSSFQQVGGEPLSPARPVGFLPALLLMLGSCLPVIGAVLIAPVLPQMVVHFAAVPNAEVLVPLALTAPALVVGLTAPFAGVIVDRLGRKRLLLAAVVLYAAVGLAPLWLASLYYIVVSRVLLGVAEAAIMTCCTTLISDYYHGERRVKLLAQQAIWASVSATVFFAIGGLIGEAGWRAPFWVYGVTIVLAPLMARFLWEPERERVSASDGRAPSVPFPRKTVTTICGFSLLGAIAFYLLPVHLGFVLQILGDASPQRVGAAMSIGSVATVAGALLFKLLARWWGVATLLAASYAALGLGFVLVAMATSYNGSLPGVIAAGFGAGLVLPSLVTWMMSRLAFEHRGKGAGAFTASFFVGQFICPLVVLGISTLNQGLIESINWFGWCFLGLALILAASHLAGRSLTGAEAGKLLMEKQHD